MQANSPQLWDDLWSRDISTQEDLYMLAKEANSIRWQRMAAIIESRLGGFEGRRVIEIGAGAGTVSALMARRGATITLLDYSDKALERGADFFHRNGLKANLIKADALALPSDLLNQFDIATSFGLIEHFRGENRRNITRAHFDVVRPGGLIFASVPNKFNPPYRLFKFIATRLNKWPFGEEYPYSRSELLTLCQSLDASEVGLFGDSFPKSFDFINPVKASAFVRNLLGLKDDYDIRLLRPERGTPLDAYLSYALVVYAMKRAK